MLDTHRKFYLYTQGSQIGPLSVSFIIDQIQFQNVGGDAFVWAEGMAQWRSIREVEEFSPFTGLMGPASAPRELNRLRRESGSLVPIPSPSLSTDSLPRPVVPAKSDQVAANLEHGSVSPTLAPTAAQPVSKRSALIIFWITACAVAVLSIPLSLATLRYLNQPTIWDELDASAAKIRALKSVRRHNAPEFARFRGSTTTPSLLIATKYSDGSRVRVHLQGRAATLVGAWVSESELVAVSDGGLVSTAPIRHADGTSLAPGLYDVMIQCLGCVGVDGQEVRLAEPLFIGPSEEAEYRSQLANYHVLVREQADSEIMELAEMTEAFLSSMGGRGGAYQNILSQIGSIVDSIDLKTVSTAYLAAPLYVRFKSLYDEYRSGRKDEALTRRSLTSFRDQLRQIQRLQSASKGFPEWLGGKL